MALAFDRRKIVEPWAIWQEQKLKILNALIRKYAKLKLFFAG